MAHVGVEPRHSASWVPALNYFTLKPPFCCWPWMIFVGDLCGLEFQLLSWTWSGSWCSFSIWSPFRTISWKIPDCQLFHLYNPSPVKCVQLCVHGCAWTWTKVKLRKLQDPGQATSYKYQELQFTAVKDAREYPILHSPELSTTSC